MIFHRVELLRLGEKLLPRKKYFPGGVEIRHGRVRDVFQGVESQRRKIQKEIRVFFSLRMSGLDFFD